jgi:hypothetical protein
MPTKWVTVRNDGDGPVMLGETYLQKGESREVSEAVLEAAKANHPNNPKWLHVVSHRTIKDGDPTPDAAARTPIAPSQADLDAHAAEERKKEQPKMKETVDPPTVDLPDADDKA